jgi:hypothetical protein
MSHRISAQSARGHGVDEGRPGRRRNGAVSEAFTLARNDSQEVFEGSLSCQSPVCEVRFEQTGVMRLEPRKYCCDQCRQDAWVIKRAAKLLEGFTDAEAIKILRE